MVADVLTMEILRDAIEKLKEEAIYYPEMTEQEFSKQYESIKKGQAVVDKMWGKSERNDT